MRATLVVLALAATAAVVPADARADGLPVVGVDAGPAGVETPAGDARYVALPAKGDTLVLRVEQASGRVLASRFVPGRFTIPVVAYDGSASGLSADGKTLVLLRPRARFPRAETTFAVLDAERLRLRETITLRGDFSFDALSPRGSWLYLVEYLSARDPSRYLVRLYDLRAGRLLPDPIIDPREVGDVMRGFPITRAASPDGRWAYTLYDGAGGHPFVHALDTGRRTALCIDLHGLAGYPNLSELRLQVGPGGETITVLDGPERLAIIDTRTFTVREPAEEVVAAGGIPDERSALPWALLGALFGAVLLALATARRLKKARRPSPASEGEGSEHVEVLVPLRPASPRDSGESRRRRRRGRRPTEASSRAP